ncbi:ATP-dependent helicase DinG [Bacillus sp. FJAT-42376]|uniref:ATP-dependent DNA helicase DinG n=1 Tax=Bacillus sp. FJAT-42376 TaxID=2014076 RepID=UPI000F4E65AE|nr:ATP-dependent DNA helicase DinG [Bacillus sp. FJAT-42376]AZB43308.1 ATP-dependent helicase DinG [Bacillus sp. FJAT-42376]
MEHRRYVVLDVETTGTSPKKGEKIIQFAAVVFEDGKITDRFMSYVNPLQPIPAFIQSLTGISDEDVENAPVFSEIADKVNSMLDGAWFVAHNVHFDLSFVQAELEQAGYPRFSGGIMDTVELSRMMFPSFESYKLSELCRELAIQHDRPHQADSDAEVTAEIFGIILKKLSALPMVTLRKLRNLSDVFISDLHELLDELIAEGNQSGFSKEGGDVDLFGSFAFSPVFNRNEEMEQQGKKETQPELSELTEIMKSRLDRYESRPQQQKLIAEVYEALLNREHMLAEAPAGSGKSLGLLIPAIKYAMDNGTRIVYSTHTTALQNQLIDRDAKLAGRIFSKEITAVILKGESHYICPHKFELSLLETDENYDSNLAKAQILIWLMQTETGDADELNLPSGGKNLWMRIHHDKLSNHPKNPYRERSFYDLARKKAEHSTLIIVNHALLLNDAAAERKQLPDFDDLLIDEAHHLERMAGEQWGYRLEYVTMHSWLQRIGHLYSGDLLASVADWFELEGEKGYDYCLEMDVLLKEFADELNDFFTTLHSFVLKRKKGSANRVSYSVADHAAAEPYWSVIEELGDRIRFYIYDILFVMKKQKQLLNAADLPLKTQSKMNEYFSYANRFEYASEAINDLFSNGSGDSAFWIEAEAKGAKNAAVICSRPVDVSEQLAASLFEKKRSVILVSGTLSVNGSFNHAIRQLGLTDFYPKQLMLPSSFDYKKQTKLLVPSDVPGIRDVSQEVYTEAVASAIKKFAPAVNGKILVLFTSYDMLKSTYTWLKEGEELDDYAILGQGIGGGSKMKLIRSFRQADKSILLGTNSFWEGIDFPGEQVKAVMMVRLPFAPPDQPVVSAKSKKLENAGINAFYEYSLPEAILKYKQGFGRLIRTEKDKGLLIVLDRRILSARYGKYFLQAMPEVGVHYSPAEELAEMASDWLQN